jgi:hypothetical protein
MNRAMIHRIQIAAAVAALALGTVYAQKKDTKDADAKDDSTPEVFCPVMRTGQLCSDGTTATLKVTEAQSAQWHVAVRRYNKAVDEATKQLQADAKTVLTPEQVAQVDRWFAVGLNPEINKLIYASEKKSK